MSEGAPRRVNSWFWRRLLTYMLTAFSMTMLVWLAWNGVQDGELHKVIAEGCLWLLFGMAFIYIGGATADDILSLARTVRGVPEKDKA